MELRQLQYFVAVVEEAGFTRAATRLHLAQPGISAQVRQLERELGQPLLDRSGRTVTTTPAGEAVLPYARAALAAAEGARQAVAEFTGLLRGQVSLGLVSGAAADGFDVAGVLADFHRAHPGIEISLTEDTSEHMLAALHRGALDIAVTGLLSPEPPPGTAHQVVVDEPLVAAMSPTDPLLTSHRTHVPFAALEGRPLISLPRGTGLRAVLERSCAKAGFTPHIAFEAVSPPLLARLAANGLGVAVIPTPTPQSARTLQLGTLPLTHPKARGRVALTWRANGPTNPAAQTLLTHLRTAFPAVPPPLTDTH